MVRRVVRVTWLVLRMQSEKQVYLKLFGIMLQLNINQGLVLILIGRLIIRLIDLILLRIRLMILIVVRYI